MDVMQVFGSNEFFQWMGKNWLELFGTATMLLYIWLEIKQKPVMWVVGFISSFVYIFVFFQSKMYGYTVLYIYYVAVSIYGWCSWRYTQQPDGTVAELKISRIRISSVFVLSAIFVVLYIGSAHALERFTDSPVPYYDALGTSISIIATWLLARKIIEHWVLWIFVNFFSAVLFFFRGLYPTAGLFVVYGIMSVAGWFQWKRSVTQRHEDAKNMIIP